MPEVAEFRHRLCEAFPDVVENFCRAEIVKLEVGDAFLQHQPLPLRETLHAQFLQCRLFLGGFQFALGRELLRPLLDFVILLLGGGQLLVPILLRPHRRDVAFELRQLRRCRHRVAEVLVRRLVALLVGTILRRRSADAEHADDEGQIWRA